jgi:nucleoside-diphosphate-sugar epimerase
VRVFLTGVSGFVGSHVAHLLVREGCEVHALVRAKSDLWRIQDVRPQLQLITGDIRDAATLDAVAERKPDCCLHLGWHATPGSYLQAPENIDLTASALKLATRLAEAGCKRFVGIGTCFEYNTDSGYLSEETPLAPAFLYSAAKAGAYLALRCLPGPMSIAWARLFYLYGPYENEGRLVPSVIRALLAGNPARCTLGEQVRDFLHVEDVASALWCTAKSSLIGAVNIGSGKPVTVATVVTEIAELLDRKDLVKLGALPLQPGDPPFVCANNAKLRTATTWQPRFDLRVGLLQTLEWWRSRANVPPGAAA